MDHRASRIRVWNRDFGKLQSPSRVPSRNSLPETEVNQHAGHVIVLGSRPDEAVEIAHHSPEQFARGLGRSRFEHMQHALLPIFFLALIERLDQAVGEDHEPVARFETHGRGFIAALCPDSERQAAARQTFDRPGTAPEDGRVVAGVDIGKGPGSRGQIPPEMRW